MVPVVLAGLFDPHKNFEGIGTFWKFFKFLRKLLLLNKLLKFAIFFIKTRL
jgi:hypothetical protein